MRSILVSVKHRLAVLRARVSDFRSAQSGVAAVEFVLMVPTMLLVWMGMVVATDTINADKKVTLLTRTLADMTTQMSAVSQADLDSIFAATHAVMWPNPPVNLGMRLTSIDIDANGKAFVGWSSVPTDGSMRGAFSANVRCSSFDTLPAALKTPRTSVILSEVTMTYYASVASEVVQQLFTTSATGRQFNLADSLFMRPRMSTKVVFNPSPAGNCPGYVP